MDGLAVDMPLIVIVALVCCATNRNQTSSSAVPHVLPLTLELVADNKVAETVLQLVPGVNNVALLQLSLAGAWLAALKEVAKIEKASKVLLIVVLIFNRIGSA
jgi:hypothetical protein